MHGRKSETPMYAPRLLRLLRNCVEGLDFAAQQIDKPDLW